MTKNVTIPLTSRTTMTHVTMKNIQHTVFTQINE